MKPKEKLFLSNKLEVRSSNIEGRGVFCLEDIERGELIEEAHIILLSDNKWENCDKELSRYVLPWVELRDDWQDFCEENEGIEFRHASRPLAVLGFGMIYNHSDDNNVDFHVDQHRFFCSYKANRDIVSGSELFINYGPIYFNNLEKK